MTIDIITLFPDIFEPFLKASIIGRAIKDKKLKVKLIDLRDFGIGAHKQVDDRPYGGGVGMVLRVDVIAKAIKKVTKAPEATEVPEVILLTPQGKTFNQKTARRLSKGEHLILICGHYEGVDERVRKLVDEEISIGDYVLSGGESAAMVVLDAVARLVPGVLEDEATRNESFSFRYARKNPAGKRPPFLEKRLGEGHRGFSQLTPGVKEAGSYALNAKLSTLLEYPQYTRPEEFEGMKVPKVLLSGDHQKIKEWRLEQSLKKTKKRRPELLDS